MTAVTAPTREGEEMGRWVVGLHPTPSGLRRIFVGQGGRGQGRAASWFGTEGKSQVNAAA